MILQGSFPNINIPQFTIYNARWLKTISNIRHIHYRVVRLSNVCPKMHNSITSWNWEYYGEMKVLFFVTGIIQCMYSIQFFLIEYINENIHIGFITCKHNNNNWFSIYSTFYDDFTFSLNAQHQFSSNICYTFYNFERNTYFVLLHSYVCMSIRSAT